MSNIDIFVWEFLGTAVLCLLGNGSVAAVVLKNSFSHGGGGDWVIIVMGWGDLRCSPAPVSPVRPERISTPR